MVGYRYYILARADGRRVLSSCVFGDLGVVLQVLQGISKYSAYLIVLRRVRVAHVARPGKPNPGWGQVILPEPAEYHAGMMYQYQK